MDVVLYLANKGNVSCFQELVDSIRHSSGKQIYFKLTQHISMQRII